MTIRTILVPFEGSETAKSSVELGLTFGRDLSAHVEVLHVRSDPKDTIPLLGEGMSVSMIEDMIRIAEKEGGERSAQSRRIFDDLVKTLSVKVADKPRGQDATAACREAQGRRDAVLPRLGRLSDLLAA